MQARWKLGDLVWIINRSYVGEFIVEGKAVIIRPLDAAAKKGGIDGGRYLVQFPDAENVERNVDPLAQYKPHDYAAKLNRQLKEAAECLRHNERLFGV